MSSEKHPEIYFSFFMFTADLRPDDPVYTKTVVRHIRELCDRGYDGFDLPIAPKDTRDHAAEVESYERLRRAVDEAGLEHVKFTTNVAAFPEFDPSSIDNEQREVGLAYLKSRVDITAALRGTIMAGPMVVPYGGFPTAASGEGIWSDALQEWLGPRYLNAQPLFEELGSYAEARGVNLAIEPVDHWETPGPNMVRDVRGFLEGVGSRHIGGCIDSAHVVLGSNGPAAFLEDVQALAADKRLHYAQVSAPDRGAVHGSWIPWDIFMGPILEHYAGPLLIEVFNAIPAFVDRLRITRRKFWIPGEDTPVAEVPSAYDIAAEGIAALRQAIRKARAA